MAEETGEVQSSRTGTDPGYRSKSVSGRKAKLSPERSMERASEILKALSVVQRQVQRGGAKLARLSGASFQQCVVSRGRRLRFMVR
ncbi:hypothetical protein NDU88_009329 [Pleurodeles waltl]|uniref:Uncharacterized protein n=1 Tax=Pleurodeles waltl TaxID=8319 RepID=A0AAV7RY70_PLEWA|nr:hypothetical protein NDU88_009329 [Pleurodeles waltl]